MLLIVRNEGSRIKHLIVLVNLPFLLGLVGIRRL